MTRTRARERSLISVMSASVLLTGALAGCDSAESQRAAFESQGYSNVQNLKNEGRPNSYRATLDSCTIELFPSTDKKEKWTAHIVELPARDADTVSLSFQDLIFEAVANAKALQENARFTKYCPP